MLNLESENVKRYVGQHDKESQKAIGAWRWQGLYDNRHLVEPLLHGDVLDIGGASGPLMWGDILDSQEFDILGRQVKYHDDREIDKKYDTIFASHVLEHYDFPGTHLQRWYGILKPGGHIIIQVPSIYNMRNHPLFNEGHRWIFIIDGDIEQGLKSHIIPLRWIVGALFDIDFIEYVENVSILCVGRKKENVCI